MKKRILIGFTALAIAAVIALSINLNLQKDALAQVVLEENKDALAEDDTPVIDCPGGKTECARVKSGDSNIFNLIR